MDGLAVDASLMTIVMTDTMYVCVMTDTILNSIAAELYRGRICGPKGLKSEFDAYLTWICPSIHQPCANL